MQADSHSISDVNVMTFCSIHAHRCTHTHRLTYSMYIHVYICTYIYIYRYKHTHKHIQTHTHTHIHVYYIHIHIFMCVYIYIYRVSSTHMLSARVYNCVHCCEGVGVRPNTKPTRRETMPLTTRPAIMRCHSRHRLSQTGLSH